ncbi:hypothetical protein Poly21_04030 [Allorhodopirellula heiligendammensis]|uniref:Uncharacterized protein n=1 Tax=Allorhodopirellula heiligendammensis TaxID=2714739 RepID=A0A5C6C297_9BACT|nr:hypothetical protein Poly21_04030 [Allorhodopirellula heiligendammensis]
MTDPKSTQRISQLLILLPGVTNARLRRSDASAAINAVVGCESLVGFDAIARCAAGANVIASLGRSESTSFRKLEPVPFWNCEVRFDDAKVESPSVCERFGFYVASFLYNEAIIDDTCLDELEMAWSVHFSREP